MKIAILANISPRWGNALFATLNLIQKLIPFEKDFFIVDRYISNSIERHLEKIAADRYDRIILCGGDGTLNRVVQFLGTRQWLERWPILLLPFGTCNDFSKLLGFKKIRQRQKNIVQLLNSVTKESWKWFNVTKVNERYFINNAGFGRRKFDKKSKNVFAALTQMKPIHLRIFCGQYKEEGDFLMFLAANGPYFSNGLHFDSSSDPEDSVLEYFFVRNVSKIRLLAKLILGRRGFPLIRPKFRDKTTLRLAGPKLEILSETPMTLLVDGELTPELTNIRSATIETFGSIRIFTL